MIEFEDPFIRRTVDTKKVHEYVDRIYAAVLQEQDNVIRSIQLEVRATTIDFRASVWTCLSKDVRNRMKEICPELL